MNKCPAMGKTCRQCGKANHYAKMCKTKPTAETGKDKKSNQVSHVAFSRDGSDDFDYDSLYIGSIEEKGCETKVTKKRAWYETILIENANVKAKIDTGSVTNCMNLKVFNNLKAKKVKKYPSEKEFETYGGGKTQAEFRCFLVVEHADKKVLQEFHIFNNNDITLLGLETCEVLGFVKRCQSEVHSIDDTAKERFINENRDVFDGIGTFREVGSLKVKDNQCPVVKPVRRIPRALYERLKSTLQDFVNREIIKPIDDEDLEWVHNLVVREKPDGKLRVCLDPKELNAILKPEVYPIPRSEEINSKLAGKKIFTVLDCKDGFYHIKLDEASANLCTFNTVFGCYKFLRLPFGLSIAPQLFQKINTRNFANIDGLIIYIDDLLIAAETEEEHDKILEQVLNRARELNVKFNERKVQYKVSEVKYLGQKYSEYGMRIDEARIKAIHDIQEPKNKKELQSILGMINFIREYIPNMSEITAPLREMLKKNMIFKWLPVHSKVLDELKRRISSAPVLGIFDENKEITIQADASKNGLGACLMQGGKPIAYASRSLTETEKRYAQIEKELLGIVFSCRKFHFFIYGKDVTLQTDHKPLVSIFKKDVAEIPSVRIQNMRMKLLKYRLKLVHVPGKLMHIADLLSRSFSQNNVEYEDEDGIKDVIHSVDISEGNREKLREGIDRDEVLNGLKKFCLNGWPTNKKLIPEALRVYFKNRNEIYVEDDLLFFNERIIIPGSLRREVLQFIHEGHQGIVKSKLRAKALVYWPGINNDIENIVTECRTCEKFRRANRKEELIPHPIPDRPFQKIGVDICEYGAKSYLVVIDYFSKWLELVPIKFKHSGEIITKLKVIFATHGIPEKMIADNVPFGSMQLREFAKDWNFTIITRSPEYPQSNGQAEKAVGIAKGIIKKSVEDKVDFYIPLLEYRNTPIPGLGWSPAQVLMSRICRSKIPTKSELLKPEVAKGVKEMLQNIKLKVSKYYNRQAHQREPIMTGERVVYRKGKTWERAKVVDKANTPRSFIIETENNRVLRRNMIHLRKSKHSDQMSGIETEPTTVEGSSMVGTFVNRKPTTPQLTRNVRCTRYGRQIIAPKRYGFS